MNFLKSLWVIVVYPMVIIRHLSDNILKLKYHKAELFVISKLTEHLNNLHNKIIIGSAQMSLNIL